ncbi:hypothetical protein DID76_04610 [Candidatus Marinamargulisbacteria bacterium SCGC AG-414-C22]|nr:hypothetical protein DID76_04610 [Candidatus Marinamargulisbacteria bacterium SCGC AG-414-C22]
MMNKKSVLWLMVLLLCMLLIWISMQSNSSSVVDTKKSTTTNLLYESDFKNIKFKTIAGKKLTFKSYKDKVLLINFWATWCGPCLIEIPELMKLQEDFADKPFSVIGISMDNTESEVLIFNESMTFNYPVIMYESEMALVFPESRFIPFSIIVNKEGKVVDTILGFESMDDLKRRLAPYM